MEVGPHASNPELAPAPDLLEVFAEREVTIFGITGTFRDLAEMCPVDLNEGQVTLEAKNEFVVKAANEGGLAIEPEYEPLFSRITEEHRLERKFTVVDAEPSEKAGQDSAAKDEKIAPPEPPVVEAHRQQLSETGSVAEKHVPKNDRSRITGALAIRETARASLMDIPAIAELLHPVEVEEPRAPRSVPRTAAAEPRAATVLPGVIKNRVPAETVLRTQNAKRITAETETETADPHDVWTAAAAQFAPVGSSEAAAPTPPSVERLVPDGVELSVAQVSEPTLAEQFPELYADAPVDEPESLLGKSSDVPGMATLSEIKPGDDQTPDANLQAISEAVPMELADSELPLQHAMVIPTYQEIIPMASSEELPAVYEEVEAVLATITDAAESDPETAETITAILREIVRLPAAQRVQVAETAESLPPEMLEEKLKELFTALFDGLGIEPEPRVLESFVKLTRTHYFEELLQVLPEAEEQESVLPDEIGTREFLQKLHYGLIKMKQAALHCYEIGSSVLRMYGFLRPLPQLA